jgi:hypothetical protein
MNKNKEIINNISTNVFTAIHNFKIPLTLYLNATALMIYLEAWKK